MRRSDSDNLKAAVKWNPIGKEIKITSKEAMNRWNKAGLGKIRDAQLRRVEEGFGGGKNS